MRLFKDDNAFLPILNWIICSLFILVLMISFAAYIIQPITQPIINATNGTDHQAVSQNAVSKGYTSISLAAVSIPIALVLGFFIYLVITDRGVQE